MDFEVVDRDEELARSRIGDVINGKWKLVDLLGCGGMAAVFAADGPDGQRVALKMLHPKMNKMPDLRERFLREGTVANRVGHPGVVRILEQTSKNDPTAVLVMELLEGEAVSDVLRRFGGKLPVATLLDYLDQLLDVLAAAHEVGIVHRDLKPDNLFVTRAGILKVLDFGIARVRDGLTEDQRTRTGVLLGTMPFMSPEQALGKRNTVDGRTDLFAAGAIAFYAMAGRCVHEAQGEGELLVAMATRPAPPLRSVVSTAPADLSAIVDQALAFSKEARYPDARTMRADVRAIREGKPPPYASRQANERSQGTQPFIAAPIIAPALAGAAALTTGPSPNFGTRSSGPLPQATAVGPSPDGVTRIGGSVPRATVLGPSPDGVTRISGSLPQATVVAPNRHGPTRVSGSLPQATVVGPSPDGITRISGSVPRATVLGPTPGAATRVGDALSHAPTLDAAALGVVAASSLGTSGPGREPDAASALASSVQGGKSPTWKRNAVWALGLVLAVALVYLLGARGCGDGNTSVEGAAGEPTITPTDTPPAGGGDYQTQDRAEDVGNGARKRGRKKH